MRKDPVKTLRRYISLGRMAVIFASAATTIFLRERGRRAGNTREKGPRYDLRQGVRIVRVKLP